MERYLVSLWVSCELILDFGIRMGSFSSKFWYPYGSKFLAWSAHSYPLPEEEPPDKDTDVCCHTFPGGTIERIASGLSEVTWAVFDDTIVLAAGSKNITQCHVATIICRAGEMIDDHKSPPPWPFGYPGHTTEIWRPWSIRPLQGQNW